MRFGVHLPQLGRRVTRDALLSFAQRCEECGYDSLWVSDHVAWPSEIASVYPYREDGAFPGHGLAWLDALGTLSFVAACTERVRLGCSVLILGYRPPVQTAKQLATLDVLCGGRLLVGVGVGWMREEFEVLGMPFDHRGSRADEQLEVFATLFGDPSPSYQGEFYSFPAVGFEPKPIQQPLPILVGGSSEGAYRRAGRYGQGFHAAFEPVDKVRAAWERVRWWAAESGRDPDQLSLSLRWYLDPEGRMDPDISLAGSPGEMTETLESLGAAGVSDVVLDPVAAGGPAARLVAVERFWDEVAT
ncbi:MAG TPA: LLM class F420-dependent oxidoreductase [Acidimicrobiales bacterium]|nr:LLM class F420-dependent oxidoreductase [Acidimicrobiales bacterium]